jgi:hypothetical protein
VRNSEAVVFTENTGTKSQSTEDLSETDAVKGDQNGSDSESSDSGTNSSSSYHGETEQIPGASAPERAGASPDTGRVKQSDYSFRLITHTRRTVYEISIQGIVKHESEESATCANVA